MTHPSAVPDKAVVESQRPPADARLLRMPTAPDSWCARVLKDHPGLHVEIESIFPALGGQVVETIVLRGRGAGSAVKTIRSTAGTYDHEILELGDEAAAIRLRISPCVACEAAKQAGVSPRFPLVLREGACEWRVRTAPGDRRALSVRYWADAASAVSMIAEEHRRLRALTPRQREILRVAVREGYYAVPRRVTLSELASSLSIAKSTLSASLQRIEATIAQASLEHA